MADLIQNKKSVIVIDEQLKDSSFLENKYAEGMVSVFNDFEEASFPVTNQKLRDLRLVELPHIIHTAFDGVRGVDFKLKGEVHVVIAFNPKNYFDVVQALGRGTRSFDKSSEGTLVQDKKFDKKVIFDNIMDFYKDGEAEDSRTEGIRMKILRLHHGKEVTVSS